MSRKMKWILLTTILAVAVLTTASVTLALQTGSNSSTAALTTARMRLNASASGLKAYSAKAAGDGEEGVFEDEYGNRYVYEQSANTGDAMGVLHLPSGATVTTDQSTGGIRIEDFVPGDKVEFDIVVTSKSDVSFYYRAELYVDASKGKELLDNIDFTAGKLSAKPNKDDEALGILRKDIADARADEKEPLAVCTDYTPWETFVAGQASIERVHVSVSLPITAKDCQNQTVELYYRAYGEQNTDILDDIAKVGRGESEKGFKTIEDAVAYVESRTDVTAPSEVPVIRVVGNTVFEEGTVRVNRSVKFEGEKVEGKNPVLKGLRLSVRDAATAEFESVDFAGDSYLDVSDCAALTLTNCTATVHPTKYFDATDRTYLSDAAFVVSGISYTPTRLTLRGNTVTTAGGAAVCIRTPLQDKSSVRANVFGSEDASCAGTAALVCNGATAGATISLEENTFYAALPLWLGSVRDARFRVMSVSNTAYGAAGKFADGTCDGVFLDSGSRKGDVALTTQDVLGTGLMVAGVDISMDNADRIRAGKLALAAHLKDEDFGTNYAATRIAQKDVALYREGVFYGYLYTSTDAEQGFVISKLA